MKTQGFLVFACLFVAILDGSEESSADYLYGVSGPGWADGNALLKIDLQTGQGTYLFPLKDANGVQTDGVEDIAINPSTGDMYVMSWSPANNYPGHGTGPSFLYKVNVQNQNVQFVGDTGTITIADGSTVHPTDLEGMAFLGSTLYASADYDADPYADEAKALVTLNPSTGSATFVGNFGDQFRNMEAIAASPDGRLFGSDIGTDRTYQGVTTHTDPALVLIDPQTGQATQIAALPSDVLPAGLAFSPDGKTLFLSTIPSRSVISTPAGPVLPSDLYSLSLSDLSSDPTALAPLKRIGPIGFNLVDGITYVAVPEPASLILLGSGLLALTGLHRWRSSRPAVQAK